MCNCPLGIDAATLLEPLEWITKDGDAPFHAVGHSAFCLQFLPTAVLEFQPPGNEMVKDYRVHIREGKMYARCPKKVKKLSVN